MNIITARKILMETEVEFCEFPQAFDGLASVEDTMDAEYEWLDAEVIDVNVKYFKGTTRVQSIVVKVAWDFKISNEADGQDDTDAEAFFK
jgi:hypothetical protein